MSTRYLGLLFPLFFTCSPAFAQLYDYSPGAATGRVRFGSYFDSDIDSINLYTGNVSLDIPVFSLPGRELSAGLRVAYNSQKWEWIDLFFNPTPLYTGGWREFDLIGETLTYTPAYVGCVFDGYQYFDVWRFYAGWRDGPGTKHLYFGQDFFPVGPNQPMCGSTEQPSFDNRLLMEVTGNYSELYAGNPVTPAYIRLRNGTVIEFTTNPTVRSAKHAGLFDESHIAVGRIYSVSI